MRNRILAFVFAAALLIAMAVPLFSGGNTALAHNPGRGCDHAHGVVHDTPARDAPAWDNANHHSVLSGCH